MTRGVRALLVVPTYASRGDLPRYDADRLRSLIRKHRPDIVVFPEGFDSVRAGRPKLADIRKASVETAGRYARELTVPVLLGLWAEAVRGDLGMQCAAYANPRPGRDETATHFYAKHSTSQVLPYELPDYSSERDPMFEPIRLAKHRLGVQLCHDQFFGLVSDRLVRNGADVLVDLTGDSVVASKWRNVLAGRSLEHDLAFFCTMTRNLSARTNRAFATAFRGGREVIPEASVKNQRRGDFVLLDSEGPTQDVDLEQDVSATEATELTIALHPARPARRVDLAVDGNGIAGIAKGDWRAIHSTGVLVLDAGDLRDPLCVHRHDEAEPRPTERNVVCFVSRRDDLSQEEAILLARLRALEHRVAVVICTPSIREVIKTSRYKNIQRIAERDGVFGVDGAFMKGTYASMAGTWPQGIPDAYHSAYRGLMAPTR